MSDPAVSPPSDTRVLTPPTRLERVVSAVGNLARPFVLYSLSLATAKAIWEKAPADVIGAAGLIVGGVYAAKATENALSARSDAQVKVAQAQSGTTP